MGAFYLLHMIGWVIFAVHGYQTWTVNVGANWPFDPAQQVTFTTYVDGKEPCCNKECSTLSAPFEVEVDLQVANWRGCDEITQCAPNGVDNEEPYSTKALLSITSNSLGNCTIQAWRKSTIGQDLWNDCYYQWDRTIRTCGNLYCYWVDSSNTIAVECTSLANNGLCNIPENPNACNIPWSSEFDPVAYSQQGSSSLLLSKIQTFFSHFYNFF